MTDEDTQDPLDAVQQCPVTSWRGTVWRLHKRKYPALDSTGSRYFGGRFHRAIEHSPDYEGWRALYVSLSPEACLGEILRNTPPHLMAGLNSYRLSEIKASLSSTVDCREISTLGIPIETLLHDYDYTLTQEIARTSLSLGAEGLLVPSATRLGDNLVIFPDQLRPESWLEVVSSRDPVLYVERGH